MESTVGMKEAVFESLLLERLTTGGNFSQISEGENKDSNYDLTKMFRRKLWKYEPHIKTIEALWKNFRDILYRLNQDVLNVPLSDTEFGQVQKVINELYTPYQAGQFLYGVNGKSEVEVDLDDGRHVILTIFDQKQIGAGNTIYQVVTQIQCPKKSPDGQDRRFDTTLLINGLPIIQIEEKRSKERIESALNQIKEYIKERQYSDIFSTVQILVAMKPTQIKYMANTTYEMFNEDFAFYWQDAEDGKVVRDWKVFTDIFLSIPMAHQMSTQFTILDGSKNNQVLKVMRPYQVYATKKVLEALKIADFEAPINRLGYIWHTTGSGKTITSFKTAWLASRMPNIDKVVFLVDRIALTRQTEENYKAYDPTGSIDMDGRKYEMIGGTENIKELKRRLGDKGNGIIVTSVQKLINLIKRKDFVLPKKNYVFIVDEAHRSTGGDSFEELQKVFKGAAWVGYTGTPMFDNMGGSVSSKTHEVFGNILHAYTIREAISDKNVLGFKVDFETTIDEVTMKEEYLPNFYRQCYPYWTDEEIRERILNMTSDDMDDMLTPSFYDNNEEHVRLVVDDIFKHWRNRSCDGLYNALFTTHVGGNSPSIPMALMYFDEFQKVNKERAKLGQFTLKVAITYRKSTNHNDGQIEANDGLKRAMKHYNEMFGTSFVIEDDAAYMEDVRSRLNRTARDGNFLDIVIVVEQLLTGFDAPQLNTLYVDRTLKGAALIQAYSRTNRIANIGKKDFGRIINYRWPIQNEKHMNEALGIYANRDSANVEESFVDGDDADPKDLVDAGILAESFKEQLVKVQYLVNQLRDMTDHFTEVPRSEAKQEEMLNVMRLYNSGMRKLKQYDAEVLDGTLIGYDYDKPEDLIRMVGMILEEEEMLTTSLVNDLKERLADARNIPVTHIELRMVHVKEVEVNYDYLTELIEGLMNAVHENRKIDADSYLEKINNFALSLEDRHLAKQINKAATEIYNGDYPPANSNITYPVKLKDCLDIVETVNVGLVNDKIYKFREQWGVIDHITNEELLDMFNRHEYGKEDFDDAGRMTELKKVAGKEYRSKAKDSKIVELGLLAYRTGLIKAIYAFANEYVSEG